MAFNGDPSAYCGKLLIQDHHDALFRKFPKIKSEIKRRAQDHDPFDISNDVLRLLVNKKVGILGAGIGGLYTALILDSLDIEYEILEASNRSGGRLKTYHFPGGGKYDYYEEGAMRFPLPKKDKDGKYKNGTHARLADLTEYPPLNQGSDRLKDKLIPYYYGARDPSHPGFYYFNGVYEPVKEGVPKGSFRGEEMGVGAAYIGAGADAIHKDVIDPFVRVLVEDLKTGRRDGWNVVLQNDAYSIRGYMASRYLPSNSLNLPPKHLPNDVINWANLLQSSSGGYDRSLTEAVFSAFAFAKVGDDNNFGAVDWKCFEGGTETLSKKIVKYLESKGQSVQPNKKVTALRKTTTSINVPSNNNVNRNVDYPSVSVQVNGSEWKNYGHVISTLPLTVLRTVDLTDAGLSTLQKNALRALDYGPAIKIAILFKSDWWCEKLGIIGGQSFTDLPIRTIVYPSYGVDEKDPKDRSKVLIASYAWTSDASRLGALSVKKAELKSLVLRNLAEAHSKVKVDGKEKSEITYEYLVNEYIDIHVKDWNSDEYAMGAFAYFTPGDYGRFYALLNIPAADGCLHFAGEAVSTRHGWVVGALDSAWKSVYEYLRSTRQTKKLERFEELWGKNWEWGSDSSLAEGDHDLLDEHFGLVTAASRVAQGTKTG